MYVRMEFRFLLSIVVDEVLKYVHGFEVLHLVHLGGRLLIVGVDHVVCARYGSHGCTSRELQRWWRVGDRFNLRISGVQRKPGGLVDT